MAARQPTVYHNHWAKHPLSVDLLPLAQMVPDKDKGRHEKRDGQPIHELLGLPAAWPPHEAREKNMTCSNGLLIPSHMIGSGGHAL